MVISYKVEDTQDTQTGSSTPSLHFNKLHKQECSNSIVFNYPNLETVRIKKKKLAGMYKYGIFIHLNF